VVDNVESSGGSSRLFALLTFATVVAALYFAKEILLPLGLAILLSFVLMPLVARLERFGLGRIPAVVVVVLISFSAIGGFAWLTTNQVVQLSARLPEYKDNLISRIRSVRSGAGNKFEEATDAIKDIGDELTAGEDTADNNAPAAVNPPSAEETDGSLPARRWIPWWNLESQPPPNQDPEDNAVAVKVVQMPPSPLSQITGWLGPLVAPLSTAGIVSVLVIFILVVREDLRNRIVRLCGTSNMHVTTEAIDDAASRLSRYLRMQLLINTIYGVVVAAGLMAIGVPSAVLWGILGLMLRFLPYVGPWIAAVMPISLALAISDDWTQPVLTLGLFIVLELVVNNVLEPWLYGSSVGVSSFGVILAAIFWTWLWGPVGLVLAMPLTVCLVVLGNNVPQLSFFPILLGDRSALDPPELMYQLLLTAKDTEAYELAEESIESASLIDFYGEVLIPALRLAEEDRHAGALSDHQESLIVESARELIEDLRHRHPAAQWSDVVGDLSERELLQMSVLCIPVEDRGDETVAFVLQQLLTAEGYATDVGSSKLLASETVASIGVEAYPVVVLTALPPLGSRRARYLCRRLRQHYADLYIVAAVFAPVGGDTSRKKLLDSGANVVVQSIPDTIAAVRRARSLTSQPPPKIDAHG